MLMRLRQICVAVPDLDAATKDFCSIFGIEVCHTDPLVEIFGLANVLMPIGPTLIELVSPIREGTAAGRFMQKRPEGGGYMAIFNCDELPAQRRHVESLGVQIANAMDADRDAAEFDSDGVDLSHYKGFCGIQLHPRDCGAAMIECNWTPGGEGLYGPYAPAGPGWAEGIRSDTVQRVLAAELQSPQAERLAARWGAILQREIVRTDTGAYLIQADDGQIRIVAAPAGAVEGLVGLDLQLSQAADRNALRVRAQACGHAVEDDALVMHGMRFRLL